VLLIEEVTFDPRMDKLDYNNQKKKLIKKGYMNKIVMLGLYAIPDISIQLNI
jgi:hypothetical protein